jgi:histidyl-tRNA synthetase
MDIDRNVNEIFYESLEAISKNRPLIQINNNSIIDNKTYVPPIGTRDFYPFDMRFRNWLFDKWKKISIMYGFEEFDAPILENEDLYKRKGGEEIVDQMYNFVDKDGYKVTLRPEMTPTMARMVLANIKETALPLKWFSIPQCWRYETIQRGRKREHFQWNMDIIGISASTAEIELICAIVDFFKEIGLTSKDVGIKINSRKLLESILENCKISSDLFPSVCIAIDKLNKIGKDGVICELNKLNINNEMSEHIINILLINDIDKLIDVLDTYGIKREESLKDIQDIFDYAKAYKIDDFIHFDPSIVRGLSYYTGIVFEGFDKTGELRAICGGGRYDKLFSLYRSPKEIPACGFGFGDCVIKELLEMKNLMPKFPQKIQVVIAPFNIEYRKNAMIIASLLRKSGIIVDMYLETSKKRVKECFSYADRLKVPWVIFVAPDEWNKGQVRVKNMMLPDGDKDKEKDININDLITFFNNQ